MAKTIYNYTFVNKAGITNAVSHVVDSKSGDVLHTDKAEYFTKPVGDIAPNIAASTVLAFGKNVGELLTIYCNIIGKFTAKKVGPFEYEVKHAEKIFSHIKEGAFYCFNNSLEKLLESMRQEAEEEEEHAND